MDIWIILYIVAGIALLMYFSKGMNAVWGGATIGLVIGLIIALLKDEWSMTYKSVAIGTIIGLVSEWIGKACQRQKNKINEYHEE